MQARGCAQSCVIPGEGEAGMGSAGLEIPRFLFLLRGKPHRGSDPDVLGCLQAQDAGGFSVGMACNKWIRKNKQNRKQEKKLR